MPEVVHRTCPAKINLALAVGPLVPNPGPRAGLHPIHSWMSCIGLHDALTLEKAPGDRSTYRRLHASGSPVGWPEVTDLVVRAHRMLEAHLARPLQINLTVRKSIPPGGGLGGGSSEAAGLLMALRECFALDISTETLCSLAAPLGSDIPFFLDDAPVPRPAIVSGTGETIERKSALEARVLLVLPGFDCPTGKVYRAFDQLGLGASFAELSRCIDLSVDQNDFSTLTNDLTAPACAVRPELGDLRNSLEQATGEQVHLSGSGSTLFLLDPRTKAGTLERIATGCRVVSTRTL